MAIKFTKDPSAVLDYVLDWSAWLVDGDTITDVSAEADTGITVDSVSFTASTTTVWLSGGSAGTTPYNVVVHVVTAAGREDDRTIVIICKDR